MSWAILRVVSAAAVLALAASAGALEITHVQHDVEAIDPSKGETVTLRFRLSHEAKLSLHLFDVRDLRIRTLGGETLPAGDHSLEWDGRDQRGKPVPPEAYRYTLEATAATGESVDWDITDYTGGETVRAKQVDWDAKAKRLRYVIAKPARVNLRIGLANNGPLLRTLLDWVPRRAGGHDEVWDGQDASGALDLTDHPQLKPAVTAFSLPDNTLFVMPAPTHIELVEPIPAPRLEREKKKDTPKRMYAYGQQTFGERRDFPLDLRMPKELPTDDAGLPTVDASSPVPVVLDLPPEELARAANERFEALFFVDGQLVFEHEIGFLPMTWSWNPEGINPGIHYITANVRGYDGHHGTATLKLRVQPSDLAKVPDERSKP